MKVAQGCSVYRVLGIAGLLAGAGCRIETGPRWSWIVQPGLIAIEGVVADGVTAPDTVEADASFTVVVKTFGSSSCTRPAGAKVTVSGLTATVAPLDSVVTGDADCTSDLRSFSHSASLTLGGAGEAAVAVVGRSEHGDTTLTYRIVVR